MAIQVVKSQGILALYNGLTASLGRQVHCIDSASYYVQEQIMVGTYANGTPPPPPPPPHSKAKIMTVLKVPYRWLEVSITLVIFQ